MGEFSLDIYIALKLSVSQSTISAYEIGERTPDLETLLAIADFFNVSLDYLVGLSEVKQRITQTDLTTDELDHLRVYRQLSDTDKGKARAYIDGLQSR